MQILSVNVGLPREVEHDGRTLSTAIFKEPVSGPVHVGEMQLEGDTQADSKSHGGVYQAVYAFGHENYATWQDEYELGELKPGSFGENLTTAGMSEDIVCIGDIYRIGECLLEVTQPRTPCFKLGLRLDRADLPRAFLRSEYTGFYLRVVEPGHVQSGDAVSVEQRDPAGVTVRQVLRLMHFDKTDHAGMRRAVAVPGLSPRWRDEFDERLGDSEEAQAEA